MTKFIHTADLGFRNLPHGGTNPSTGMNTRFEDVLNNFQTIVDHAINEKIPYFVIAGDINESRNPESILIEKFSCFIADLSEAGIKTIIIAGNHDIDSAKGTSTSISYLKSLKYPNVFIADMGPESFELDDIAFHCLPTMYPHQDDCKDNVELTRNLNDLVENIELVEGVPNILVAHYSLDTTFGGLDVDEAVLISSKLSKFSYVALGHIHKYEMSKTFTGGYSGSIYVKDFGEDLDKRFNVVSVDAKKKTEIEVFDVPERAFTEFTIDVRQLDVDEAIEKIKADIDDIEGHVVKVILMSDRRFSTKLVHEHLREQRVFHYAPIAWKIEKDDEVSVLDVKQGTSDSDIVALYLKEKDVDAEFAGKVTEYMSDVIKKRQDEIGA